MKRIRPAHSPEKLREIYASPHDSSYWVDHAARVDATIAVGKFMMSHYDPWAPVVVDLTAGDGKIAKAVASTHVGWEQRLVLGDYFSGYPVIGPIEETILDWPANSITMFVLSETIEHIDDPLSLLIKIRERTSMLLLSTPIGEPLDSRNEQRYWSWSVSDMENLLKTSGFDPVVKNLLYLPTYYDFQIWGCR